MVLLKLLGIILAALAFAGLVYLLERWLKRPGLAMLLIGVALLAAGTLGLLRGERLLPTLFVLQGIGFLFQARWRRTLTRTSTPTSSPAA